MPVSGVSVEWVEAKEDEIARIITAQEHVRRMRRFVEVMAESQFIMPDYEQRAHDSLDYVAEVLLTAKRNTAQLRRMQI